MTPSNKEKLLAKINRCEVISEAIFTYIASNSFQKRELSTRQNEIKILKDHYFEIWAQRSVVPD